MSAGSRSYLIEAQHTTIRGDMTLLVTNPMNIITCRVLDGQPDDHGWGVDFRGSLGDTAYTNQCCVVAWPLGHAAQPTATFGWP